MSTYTEVVNYRVGGIYRATVRDQPGIVVTRLDAKSGSYVWAASQMVAGVLLHYESDVTDVVGPLAVLDLNESNSGSTPESVLRYAAKIVQAHDGGPGDESRFLESLAAQVEQQQASNPTEPTGFGATVLDRNGVYWHLTRIPMSSENKMAWVREPGEGLGAIWRMNYADIDVVEIVSQGVRR